MPTHDRRRFVQQAIAYFLRQDYEPRELVVVDDGDDPIDDLVPDDDRIRYVRLGERLPLGRKRNLACEVSRGDVICHWDDDDWYAPNRVRIQVGELLGSGRDVCGVSELLHYRPAAGDAWMYRSQPGDRPWLAGSMLAYRRSTWTRSPFPDLHVGEDAGFVWQMDSARVHAITGRGLCVALLHGANTAEKNLADGRWTRRPLDEVSRLLRPDRDFYAGLRNRRGARPRPRVGAAPAITVVAPFLTYDGYGSMGEYLALGLRRAGARVDPIALDVDRDGLSREFLALLDGAAPQPDAPVLFYSWPSPSLRPYAAAPELFVNTMWESSELPAAWPRALNAARAVIVPTRFVADVCRRSGVRVPIEVIPEGVDPAVYRYEERPERETITTLMVGPVVERKHTLEGIAAWRLAFAGDPLARLVIKARFGYGNYTPDDPRITFVDRDERTRGIAHWYREADVLMALGNEGFGLPLVEGMATGLPVVALDSEGQSDACREAGDRLLSVPPARWQRCDDAPFGPAGVRGVPGVADVAERLRWVASHRDEARSLGRAASAWALARRDVWEKGPAVLAALERHARVPLSARTPPPSARTPPPWARTPPPSAWTPPVSARTPPVSARTLWAPSLGTACGISEYARELARAAGAPASVTATAAPGDLRGMRLLHVQHEPSLIGDDELAQLAGKARDLGVPVVVTEHALTAAGACAATGTGATTGTCATSGTCGAAGPAWERDVDALVAHTSAGAAVLRARCPDQRVAHIPHGCPAWFPARKRMRGRVVGAFGFLEAHKGIARLVEAAGLLGDIELALFCHVKPGRAEPAWQARRSRVPLRWERDFLAPEVLARRLAAEVDVLVYWYDETTLHAVSGAVRIGLATGVPVLASPTRWFDDVRDATYQPDDLAAGIARLLEDTALRQDLVAAARDHCHANSWERTAQRHQELWRTLERA